MAVQARRLVLIFAIAIALFVLLRFLLVPRSFGRYGHYRADAVEAVAAQPLGYAGHAACEQCHDDVAAVKKKSSHHWVTCETCHGLGHTHAEDPTEASLQLPDGRQVCLYCHDYNPSRPTGFPQVEAVEHAGDEPCVSCHAPHAPALDVGVPDCGSCHASIRKDVTAGPHGVQGCAGCHKSGDGHAVGPRKVVAGKPETREFCGGCHGNEAASPEDVRRVDLAEHGADYLCWQCHNPHLPQGQVEWKGHDADTKKLH